MRKKPVPDGPQTRFRSLTELLAQIGNVRMEDAYGIANEEHALAIGRINWMEQLLKVRAEKQDPALVDYSWDVNLLLSRMEGKLVGPKLGSAYTRDLIKKAMEKWRLVPPQATR